ncbi:8029_t:CDS:2, partial [Scutellospora calospora]
ITKLSKDNGSAGRSRCRILCTVWRIALNEGSLIDFSEEHDIDLCPQVVLTDFESAVINAIQLEFDNVQHKGIQTSGLAIRYGTDENFSILIRHIPALAFLPHNEIPAAFDELKTHIPAEANDIIKWFEEYYVHGKIRRVHRNGTEIRSEPLFPPKFWSVCNNMEFAFPRTQNSVEGWHRRWETLVNCAHAGVFKIIKEIQKEQTNVEVSIEAVLRGAPRPQQRKHIVEHEQRIQVVFNDRDNWSLMEYLRGIAHNVYF